MVYDLINHIFWKYTVLQLWVKFKHDTILRIPQQISCHDVCTIVTHWGRVTHICVGKLTVIGSDQGLSPGRIKAIIYTNAWIVCIRTLVTTFNEILSHTHTFSFKKMHMKISSTKWRPYVQGGEGGRWGWRGVLGGWGVGVGVGGWGGGGGWGGVGWGGGGGGGWVNISIYHLKKDMLQYWIMCS